jgi:hypothetical protein
MIKCVVFARNQVHCFRQPEAPHVGLEYAYRQAGALSLLAVSRHISGDRSTAYIVIPLRAKIRAFVPVPHARSQAVPTLAIIGLNRRSRAASIGNRKNEKSLS